MKNEYPDKVGRGGYYIESYYNEWVVRDRFYGDEIEYFKLFEDAKEWVLKKLEK